MLGIINISGASRLVAVDIETTGHPVRTRAEIARMPRGLRLSGVIIQIGCAELFRDGDTWRTGRTWETLVNPDGPVSPASIKVHGIHPAALKSAPRFPDIRPALEEFIGDALLVAHSAHNEMEYLNYEMRRAGLAGWDDEPYHGGRFLDTQVLARDAFPGAPGSLDVLCDRLWIDRSDRFQHHGALLDAQLTAEAFVKLTTGFVQDEVRVFSV